MAIHWSGPLDRFTTCNSTVKYKGQRATREVQRDIQETSCNVFSGSWVFDNVSLPLYNESDCPYMSDQLACQKHGRPDLMYQNWRWQPHGCNLKRYSPWLLSCYILQNHTWHLLTIGYCMFALVKVTAVIIYGLDNEFETLVTIKSIIILLV